MGIDYRAVLAVGKEFDDDSEVEDFVRANLTLTEEEEEILDEDGITEALYNRGDLKCECLNAYHGSGFYLGFKLNPRNVERFAEDVSDAINKWNALFPNDEAEIIHTVMVY